MFRDSTRIASCVSRAALLPVAMLLACMGGCDHRSVTEPAALESSMRSSQPFSSPEPTVLGAPPAPRRLRYPLAVGNSWDYSFRSKYTRVIDGQSEAPRVTVIALHDEVVGVQHYGTQEFYELKESHPPHSGRVVSLLREDSNGLFVWLLWDQYARALDEVSAAVGSMPTTAAHREAHDRAAAKLAAKLVLARCCSGVAAPSVDIGVTKQQWLAYPLFVGARWKMSESPLIECTVTARERVRVPAGTTLAWRVRTTPEWFGDGDRVETWYSAAGLVRYSVRMEQDIVDLQGNVLGTVKYEGDQTLTAFHLDDVRPPRRLAAAP